AGLRAGRIVKVWSSASRMTRKMILSQALLPPFLGPCPGDCSAIRGTGLWMRPRPVKRQVRAEEHEDAAGIAGLIPTRSGSDSFGIERSRSRGIELLQQWESPPRHPRWWPARLE